MASSIGSILLDPPTSTVMSYQLIVDVCSIYTRTVSTEIEIPAKVSRKKIYSGTTLVPCLALYVLETELEHTA